MNAGGWEHTNAITADDIFGIELVTDQDIEMRAAMGHPFSDSDSDSELELDMDVLLEEQAGSLMGAQPLEPSDDDDEEKEVAAAEEEARSQEAMEILEGWRSRMEHDAEPGAGDEQDEGKQD